MMHSHPLDAITAVSGTMRKRSRKPQLNRDGKAKAKTYVIDRFIANGGFSQVFTASKSKPKLSETLSRRTKTLRHGSDRPKYAAKVFTVKTHEEDPVARGELRESKRLHYMHEATTEEAIEEEIELSWLCRSREYVVQVVEGLLVKPDEAWVIMECMDYSLNDALRLVELNESDVFSITAQVACGLEHIHSRGVVHCDIKCGNVLLSRTGHVKICDFGCARLLPEGELCKASSVSGIEEFLAPELVLPKQEEFEFDHRVDVWALGIVVHKLLRQGQAPNFGDEHAFNEQCWKWYEKSNSFYYERLIGSAEQELSEEFEVQGTSEAEKECQRRRVQLFIVMRKCLVPLPSGGPDSLVTRGDTLERLTSAELVASELAATKKLGLKRRHRQVLDIVRKMAGAEVDERVDQFEVLL